MEITIKQSNHLKSIAILMMLFLHLFNTLDYEGLFTPLIYIGEKPLVFYLSLFSDACVPIFAFVSGFGLYYKYKQNREKYNLRSNVKRIYSLYKIYWIILFIFVLGLGLFMQVDGYPGDLSKFLLAFSGLTASSYNGAAWFFTIYVLFVIFSKPIFQILDRFPKSVFISLLALYFVAFYFRVYKADIFNNAVLHWLHTNLALFGTTLFQFLLGAYTLKYSWKEKVSIFFEKIPLRNVSANIGIIGLILFHAYIPNFIVAPITGLGFILLFTQMNLPKFIENILDFLTPHATNIWLAHMFFYLIFFRDFIYSPKYVIPIFVLLVICCVVTSYVVNFILGFKLRIHKVKAID
ncbi:acyltransferase [Acinetobacter sp. NS-4]|uniref:acyltransferase family protein n=1 Tax=Acinetobacter sp. NS-4 TaxID=3127956 RepID=UPI00307E8B91